MTDKKLLEKKIEASGYKKGFIAERMGLSRQGLYLKIEGKNDFTVPEVQTLCDLLDIRSLEERNAIFFAQKVDA